jgi:Protein of unknown function (DUF3106)
MLRGLLLLLFGLAATAAFAEPPVDVERKRAAKPTAAKPAPKPAAKPKANVRPMWAELNAEQQKILAPLKADWEMLEPERRRKWIGIAKRYPTMKAQEQERIQRRMQTWAKLSPEQRRQARETYKQIVKAPPEKRSKLRQQWAEYQALPERERDSLVAPSDRKPR